MFKVLSPEDWPRLLLAMCLLVAKCAALSLYRIWHLAYLAQPTPIFSPQPPSYAFQVADADQKFRGGAEVKPLVEELRLRGLTVDHGEKKVQIRRREGRTEETSQAPWFV